MKQHASGDTDFIALRVGFQEKNGFQAVGQPGWSRFRFFWPGRELNAIYLAFYFRPARANAIYFDANGVRRPRFEAQAS